VLAAAVGVLIAGFAISVWVAGFARWACSSGYEIPWSFEADVCDAYAGSFGFTWWLAVIWPGIAFGASQLVPVFRRRPLLVAVPAAGLGVAFWLVTAAVVFDV